jgi:purine-binding chemotaxis protein CheW
MSAARLANGPRSAAVTTDTVGLVVFRLDRERYALPLATVDRIVRAVAVTPLPRAPAVVTGAIDVAGQVIPVLSLRHRFGLPERPITPDDHFILARAGQRTVALTMDQALGVIEHARGDIVPVDSITPHLQHVRGVLQLPDGLVIIQDLERFLSLDGRTRSTLP